jgi:hypothetical protein
MEQRYVPRQNMNATSALMTCRGEMGLFRVSTGHRSSKGIDSGSKFRGKVDMHAVGH